MNDLNPEQRRAVRHLHGPVLVLAGAGSGKTRVITRKIVHLIRDCGHAPRHVAAVTFTNKAAREMRERVSAMLGRGEGSGLRVSTFHTLGLDILRREGRALGLRPGFSIHDARDSLKLIQELAGRNTPAEAQPLQWRISRWKNAATDPAAALAAATDEHEAAAARVYAEYVERTRAFNVVDFDDLISLPLALLEGDAEVRERWQGRIRYLLVDEYQDTNRCQYRLVRQLVGVRGALTAVGDDDQSIYAWRGAEPDNLRLLAEDFARLEIIRLERNYRSGQRILAVANHLISHNPHILGKRLWSDLPPGEPIRVVACRTPEHEAEWLVADLIQHRLRHGARHGDYAILYRGNHQSRLLEKVLGEHRIPYRVAGGSSFFEHAEVRDLMAYLRLITNPADDSAFLRIVNTPRREIGPATLSQLAAWAGERRLPLLEAAAELGLGSRLDARAAERLGAFARWIGTLAERAAAGESMTVVRDLVDQSHYRAWVRDQAADPRVAERRLANVDELLRWLEDRAPVEGAAAASLAERVARLTLQTLLESGDIGDGDAVRLLTLHAAKGLEFPHVYLIGLEEDLLPHRNSIDDGALEEERRLLYVGITRARQTLTLSHALQRKRYGAVEACPPSRFIDELPVEHVQMEGLRARLPVEERKARGRAQLAGLRAMLGG